MQLLIALQIDGATLLGDRHISLIRHAFRGMEAHGGCQIYNQGQTCLVITPGNTELQSSDGQHEGLRGFGGAFLVTGVQTLFTYLNPQMCYQRYYT